MLFTLIYLHSNNIDSSQRSTITGIAHHKLISIFLKWSSYKVSIKQKICHDRVNHSWSARLWNTNSWLQLSSCSTNMIKAKKIRFQGIEIIVLKSYSGIPSGKRTESTNFDFWGSKLDTIPEYWITQCCPSICPNCSDIWWILKHDS